MIIALDLETTGVKPAVDRPVQIGLVAEQEGVRRTLLNTLVNPNMAISEGAYAVHGISEHQVQGAPDAGIAAWSTELLIRELNPTCVVGFNSECFDVPMLSACLGREAELQVPHLDVLSVAYRYLPGQPSYKLTALYQEFVGRPLEGAHGAVADANATLDLLKAIRVRVGMTLEKLVEDMAVPKPYVVFPFGKYAGELVERIPAAYGRWCLTNFTDIRPDLKVTLESITRRR